jgi:hypothetical protein
MSIHAKKGRKYQFNERYFQIINSPAQAYWLGFITADGGISLPPSRVLALNLAARDAEQLAAFQHALGRKAPIRYAWSNHGTRVARFAVSSKLLVDDLQRCGVGPRKSLVQRPWNGPHRLMSHYWRGVFDGDGSLGLGKAHAKTWRHNYWSASLTGSRAMVLAFRSYVVTAGGTRGCLHRHGRAWKLTWGGIRPPCVVARLLYSGNPSAALGRKFKLAQRMLRDYQDFCLHNRARVGRLRELIEQAITIMAQMPRHPPRAKRWLAAAQKEI